MSSLTFPDTCESRDYASVIPNVPPQLPVFPSFQPGLYSTAGSRAGTLPHTRPVIATAPRMNSQQGLYASSDVINMPNIKVKLEPL